MFRLLNTLLWLSILSSMPSLVMASGESVAPAPAPATSASAGGVDAMRARIELKTCLKGAIRVDENRTMIRWFFTVLATNPDFDTVVRIDERARVDAERETAAILERLFMDRCAPELKIALRTAGNIAWQDAVTTVFEGLKDNFLDFSHMEPAVDAMLERLNVDRIDRALRAE